LIVWNAIGPANAALTESWSQPGRDANVSIISADPNGTPNAGRAMCPRKVA